MGGAAAPVVVCDALGAAEVLGQEVELVHGGLGGQLVQPLLRRAGGLQDQVHTWTEQDGECPKEKENMAVNNI